MTIIPITKIERETMGAMGILQVIDYGVFVCICRFYYDVFKKHTPYAFVHESHFSQLEKSKCCGKIIDNRYYAPICVLGENILEANLN